MLIKEILIKEYPLNIKVETCFECYKAKPRKYVVFLDEKINKNNMESLLDKIIYVTEKDFPQKRVKTLIVVGYTDEQFGEDDLVFFNGKDTFIVFYLKNTINNEIFYNEQRVFFFSADWNKIIKRFNEILK